MTLFASDNAHDMTAAVRLLIQSGTPAIEELTVRQDAR